jgi:hypothetical protein
MKTFIWILVVFFWSLFTGCGNFACKQDVPLGMDEQDAIRQIPGIHLVAEEFNRNEYSCELYDDCSSKSWLRSTTPYKLNFENARLLRIEINQDELTRRELNHAVEMRYGYYRW